jgi:AAA-like domain
VTSTEPYLFIDRPHESPFNVGEVLELKDFTLAQMHQLNELHGAPLFQPEVAQLYELLHGQPYLSRKGFYVVKCGMTPGELMTHASSDSGPFADHLRNYFLRLLDYPELVAALKQVVCGRDHLDARLAYRMQAAGLVRSEAGKTVPRCQLYSEYFGKRL